MLKVSSGRDFKGSVLVYEAKVRLLLQSGGWKFGRDSLYFRQNYGYTVGFAEVANTVRKAILGTARKREFKTCNGTIYIEEVCCGSSLR